MRLKPLNAKLAPFILASILIFAQPVLAEEASESAVKNFSVDKKNKTISYTLTKPATVRLRVGSISGPLYRTLVNWESQKEGSHTVEWDGMDASGAFNILDSKNFIFSFNYYLAGKEDEVISEHSDSGVIFTDSFIGRASRSLNRSQNHKNHEKGHCRDITAVFHLPNTIDRTKEGLPMIKAVTPIIIDIPREEKSWFRQERFSINIYVDDVFVSGEALAYAPYTWNFNPKGINKGRHLVTVNIKGFNDHMGVGSLPIYVEKAK